MKFLPCDHDGVICGSLPSVFGTILCEVWLFGTDGTWHHGDMRIFTVLLALCLCACSTGIDTKKYNAAAYTPESFTVCHGYSCTHKSKAGFSDKEWNSIAAIFKKKPAKDAAGERGKIGYAIAKMETYAGAKTGTDIDLPMAVSFKENIQQMDCIDETVNTTHYLEMLQGAGLLTFHEPALPTHRGYFIDGRWPHNTAVIQEKGGDLWVVDSFYRANGEEPYILPRADWLAGWKPPGANQ